jgi:hypothetical protein
MIAVEPRIVVLGVLVVLALVGLVAVAAHDLNVIAYAT